MELNAMFWGNPLVHLGGDRRVDRTLRSALGLRGTVTLNGGCHLIGDCSLTSSSLLLMVIFTKIPPLSLVSCYQKFMLAGWGICHGVRNKKPPDFSGGILFHVKYYYFVSPSGSFAGLKYCYQFYPSGLYSHQKDAVIMLIAHKIPVLYGFVGQGVRANTNKVPCTAAGLVFLEFNLQDQVPWNSPFCYTEHPTDHRIPRDNSRRKPVGRRPHPGAGQTAASNTITILGNLTYKRHLPPELIFKPRH